MMNERIKELAKEANANELSYAYYRGEKRPENAVTLHSVDLEKFAELIVRECIAQASISNGHGNNQWDKALTFAADNIKKHFGVEE